MSALAIVGIVLLSIPVAVVLGLIVHDLARDLIHGDWVNTAIFLMVVGGGACLVIGLL